MKKPKCPKCDSVSKVVRIKYGYPSFEMSEDAEKGKVKLGGCMATEEDPDWHCKKCEYEWNSKNI